MDRNPDMSKCHGSSDEGLTLILSITPSSIGTTVMNTCKNPILYAFSLGLKMTSSWLSILASLLYILYTSHPQRRSVQRMPRRQQEGCFKLGYAVWTYMYSVLNRCLMNVRILDPLTQRLTIHSKGQAKTSGFKRVGDGASRVG